MAMAQRQMRPKKLSNVRTKQQIVEECNVLFDKIRELGHDIEALEFRRQKLWARYLHLQLKLCELVK